MKLRTRLDVFSAALLSALGAAELTACGGSATTEFGDSGGTSSGGSGGATASGGATSTGGSVGKGGAGTGGSVGKGGTTGTGGGPVKTTCQNPKYDPATGYETCDGGWKHRPTKTQCPSKVGDAAPDLPAPPGSTCTTHADCKEKAHGYCAPAGGFGGPSSGALVCFYGCVSDGECAAGQICECGPTIGQCVQATCTVDAECGAGLTCRSYDPSQGCMMTAFACQQTTDQCASDSDCTAPSRCYYDSQNKRFACSNGGCAIGRPFLVEGCERLADVATRADWQSNIATPNATHLDAELRARLASEWTRIALMEHASIAAFARFNLQLLSLGAPAELIELATRAIADETRHAKACFALASTYADKPVGPGALSIVDSLAEVSLEQIVIMTIREGCIGETVAAIEAREASEHVNDPALRELLQQIAADETRHAELAWRFVRWALTLGGPSLQHSVRAAFATELAAVHEAGTALESSDKALLRAGIVPEAMRRSIRAQALRQVVTPCLRALENLAENTREKAPTAILSVAATA